MTLYNRIFIFFIMMFAPIISSFANTEIELSTEDSQVISQLLKNIEPNNPTVIDLTQPKNEKGYIALLQSHSITKQKNPDIFENIETIKAHQKAIFERGEWLEIKDSLTEPANYFSNPRIVFSEDSKSISAETFGSLYLPDSNTLSQESLQISLSILGKDKKGNIKIITSTIKENIRNTDLRYFLISTNKYNLVNLKQFDSIQVVASVWGKKNGKLLTNGPVLIVSNTLTDFDDPLQYFQPYKMNNIAPTHVKNPLTKPVIVCLNRANPEPGAPSQCDYGPTSPGNPTIKLEIAGNVTFNNPIKTDTIGKPEKYAGEKSYVDLVLIGLDTGGACKLSRDINDNTFWKHTKVNNDPAKGVNTNLSWDFSKNTGYADFGPICWKNNERYVLTLSANIVTTKGDKVFFVPFTYTNDPYANKEDNKSPSLFIYPPIQIQY
ncbi:hypothetical protein [Photorhabdus cinerea]|uniref:Uncharacterized protein n=1 Tax=Photorhabdus cinerea TaxID=471575 RepID=A0A7X5TIQ3_9GAMM|nr:hypothetical protein [Photorhabdus cinerea]NHB93813.1 hypothetical protein [Photorhabdus cinerea]